MTVEPIRSLTEAPTPAERLALRVLQFGAVAVVLAAVPFKLFELDRFFVPKELVLHATALLVALLLLPGARRVRLGRIDWLLIGFLLLSLVSSVFATNPWLAMRATGVSLSGVTLFWAGRRLAAIGLRRELLRGLALAAAIGAATALLQTYGVRTEFFSLNRAPGGTFGNRNFVAHLAAIALPLVFYSALRARRMTGVVLGAVIVAAVAAALFLTRSRAAWLAVIAAAGLLLPFLLRARRELLRGALLGRLLILLGVMAGGVAAAALLPNSLNWRSDNPYLESARGVVNYQEGSGAGRLVQYRNSAEMALAHPLLGVGPGNWPVVYPRHAARRDPSLASDGMTANPWPSSDWVAFLAERGPAVVVLLALALARLLAAAWDAAGRAGEEGDPVAAPALAAVLMATVVTGLFDAVLLLAVPAFFAWTALGALAPPPRAEPREIPAFSRGLAWMAALLVGAVLVAQSGGHLAAMQVVDAGGRVAALERAAVFDPGSYRIRMLLARRNADAGRCARAREHAEAAAALFPAADAPARIRRACGGGRRR